jgi:N-acetylmuramoyl-L-alanine amidase
MVLLAPDVPAVLLEMGFLSNAQDEQRLRDPAQRAQLVEGVAASIDDYFAESTRIAAR